MESLQTNDFWMLIGGVLLLAGILSSLVATRFGAPLLLVFLVIGMLAGEDGPGGIAFSNYQITYALGSVALAVILFDGGLRTRLNQVRVALAPAGVLATLGVVITAGLTGVAVHYILDLGWIPSLLIGSIVASTDAAAVFFLLRSNGLHLQRRVGATLEVESGSNDPMAIFLTLLLLGLAMSPDALTPGGLALSLLQQIGVGGLAGYAGGRVLALALNRLDLPSGLHPLLAVSGAIALVPLTNMLGGSGFLAVYIAGLVVGNRPVRAFANVLSVQDAATWLAQMLMFLVLGLLVTPSQLLDLALPALAIAAFLMLVARPLAVVLCLWPFGFGKRELAFVSWVGLRGAVGIFLASVPMLVGLPDAQMYFNIGFVVVLTSLLVQGWSLSWAAFRLGVAVPRRDPPSRRVELDLPGQLEHEMVGYRVAPECALLSGRGRLPAWARPVLVVRRGHVLSPEEAGALQIEDYAYYLAPPGRVIRLDWLFAEGAEAREAERELFGEFTLPGNVPLGPLADFYGLKLNPRMQGKSAAELFADRYDEQPQIGDSLEVGNAVLVVRDLTDERVSRVGLKFRPTPAPSRLARSRAGRWVERLRRPKESAGGRSEDSPSP
ncbi:MAG: potassium/proton antiporter [Lysobacterales bacterium]